MMKVYNKQGVTLRKSLLEYLKMIGLYEKCVQATNVISFAIERFELIEKENLSPSACQWKAKAREVVSLNGVVVTSHEYNQIWHGNWDLPNPNELIEDRELYDSEFEEYLKKDEQFFSAILDYAYNQLNEGTLERKTLALLEHSIKTSERKRGQIGLCDPIKSDLLVALPCHKDDSSIAIKAENKPKVKVKVYRVKK